MLNPVFEIFSVKWFSFNLKTHMEYFFNAKKYFNF